MLTPSVRLGAFSEALAAGTEVDDDLSAPVAERADVLPDQDGAELLEARRVAAAGIKDRVRLHDLRHAALMNLAATGASPIAVMATAGHRSMQTTKRYVHLAGIVFRDDADALGRRLLGVPGTGTNQPETASLSGPG